MCPIINQRVCRFGGWFVDFLGHLWTIQSQTQPSLCRKFGTTSTWMNPKFLWWFHVVPKGLLLDLHILFVRKSKKPHQRLSRSTNAFLYRWSRTKNLHTLGFVDREFNQVSVSGMVNPLIKPMAKVLSKHFFISCIQYTHQRVFWHCVHLHHWTIFWISLIQSPPHEFSQNLFCEHFHQQFLKWVNFHMSPWPEPKITLRGQVHLTPRWNSPQILRKDLSGRACLSCSSSWCTTNFTSTPKDKAVFCSEIMASTAKVQGWGCGASNTFTNFIRTKAPVLSPVYVL